MAKEQLTARKLRENTAEELLLRLEETKKELFRLRVQSTTKESSTTHGIGAKKREIARILTVLNEKKRQAEQAATS